MYIGYRTDKFQTRGNTTGTDPQGTQIHQLFGFRLYKYPHYFLKTRVHVGPLDSGLGELQGGFVPFGTDIPAACASEG